MIKGRFPLCSCKDDVKHIARLFINSKMGVKFLNKKIIEYDCGGSW